MNWKESLSGTLSLALSPSVSLFLEVQGKDNLYFSFIDIAGEYIGLEYFSAETLDEAKEKACKEAIKYLNEQISGTQAIIKKLEEMK